MDDTATWLQAVGYLGSALIALSFSMSNMRTLRRINLVGAGVFAIYGFLLQAWPVVLLNSYIVLTDIWHLWQLEQRRELFSMLPISETGSVYRERFVAFHQDEIDAIFPDFDLSSSEAQGWWILRNLQPVGLFMHRPLGDGASEVVIDFVIPAYRDMKTAQWFFDEGLQSLREAGVTSLRTSTEDEAHLRYLRRVGFERSHEGHYQRRV